MRGKPWTKAEEKLLRQFYEWIPTEEIADHLGFSVARVLAKANKLGLRKAPELIAEMARERTMRPDHGGRSSRFQKGIVPHNKGRKSPGVSPGRMSQTQFKKGDRNGWAKEHLQPIGTLRVWDGWLYRKVTDISGVPMYVNWRLEHHLRWERFRGPVPRGYVLAFKDADRMNVKLSNLEMITRRELVRRNHWKHLPKPLQEVILLKGAINRVITCKERNHGKKQDERPAKSPVRNARAA